MLPFRKMLHIADHLSVQNAQHVGLQDQLSSYNQGVHQCHRWRAAPVPVKVWCSTQYSGDWISSCFAVAPQCVSDLLDPHHLAASPWQAQLMITDNVGIVPMNATDRSKVVRPSHHQSEHLR